MSPRCTARATGRHKSPKARNACPVCGLKGNVAAIVASAPPPEMPPRRGAGVVVPAEIDEWSDGGVSTDGGMTTRTLVQRHNGITVLAQVYFVPMTAPGGAGSSRSAEALVIDDESDEVLFRETFPTPIQQRSYPDLETALLGTVELAYDRSEVRASLKEMTRSTGLHNAIVCARTGVSQDNTAAIAMLVGDDGRLDATMDAESDEVLLALRMHPNPA